MTPPHGIFNLRQFAILAILIGLAGCSTVPVGQRWGESATATPGWDRVRNAAVSAGRSPWVWAPLAGAALLQVDSWDRDVSDWARDETPVFGSQSSADDWSDGLRAASIVSYGASALATLSGDLGGEWMRAKAAGAAVGLAAFAVTSETTGGLKTLAKRGRPNGVDEQSFPSGHASTAAVFGTLTTFNLESIAVTPGARTAMKVGVDAVTVATAWARVEAGAHHPSDALFGMALGSFVGAWFNDAFLGNPGASRLVLSAEPLQGGAAVRWGWRFR